MTLKATITILALTISAPLWAQDKPSFGVELDGFMSNISGISKEYSGIGYSDAGYKQKSKVGFGITLLANIPVYENISLETGFGVTNFRSDFEFDKDNTLNIKLNYIKLPIMAAYRLPISSANNAVHFALGVNIKYLYRSEDNFSELLKVKIGGQDGIDRYNRWVVAPQLNIGYSHKMSDNKTIRLDALVGYDISKFKDEDRGNYGFYNNLNDAHFLYYGLSLKYYFSF